jgi:hypothetical protein
MSVLGEIAPVCVSEGKLEHGHQCDLPGPGKPHRRNAGASLTVLTLPCIRQALTPGYLGSASAPLAGCGPPAMTGRITVRDKRCDRASAISAVRRALKRKRE